MSRSCEHAIEYLYNYLDDELTWFRRTRIQWHLRKCNDCCGGFEFEERFKQYVRSNGADEAPAELVERIRTFLRQHGNDPAA